MGVRERKRRNKRVKKVKADKRRVEGRVVQMRDKKMGE